ncbi:hypothetical protein GUA87_09625 [Sneathiella sp. P13V-1]|uniref:hypothetical protein n=1 Tax=Sneathiella sp. P13V-1 TaxID=2697366 RepID=UPI00187B6553|nr:hypothetical protein [Sneathiella sp. P13V-1]MBE7637101.1 hypothetical protein [Sneathiella sp. P13V-1]
MLKKLMISAVVGALSLGAATIASAATLSVSGGSNATLGSNFDLNATTGLSNGDSVKLFDGTWFNGVPNTDPGGLVLDGAPAQLKFEYLGSEAGDENRTIFTQGTDEILFNNKTSSVGDSVIKTVNANGLVPFAFENDNGRLCFIFCIDLGEDQAPNTGDIDWGLSLAFYQVNPGEVIALFGDGSGDADFDDMAIRISVVPLPPAVALFAGALFGLGWLSRRRKAAATA